MKLTNQIKDSITKKVLAEKFDAKFAAHDAKVSAFANRLLDEVLKGVNISKVPENWFYHGGELSAYFNGNYHRFTLGKSRPLPYFVTNTRLRFAAGSPEDKELNRLAHEKSLMEAEQTDLKREVFAVLAASSTVKKLLELWPEAEKYIPSASAPPPAIVNVDRLRNLLK